MAVWFSVEISRDRAELTIVATFTTTANARMIISKKCRRCKTAGNGGVIVTLTAFSLRRDMIKLLGRCNTGVMAGRTIVVNDSRIMVEGVSKSRVVVSGDKMTCRAVLGSLKMAN